MSFSCGQRQNSCCQRASLFSEEDHGRGWYFIRNESSGSLLIFRHAFASAVPTRKRKYPTAFPVLTKLNRRSEKARCGGHRHKQAIKPCELREASSGASIKIGRAARRVKLMKTCRHRPHLPSTASKEDSAAGNRENGQHIFFVNRLIRRGMFLKNVCQTK